MKLIFLIILSLSITSACSKHEKKTDIPEKVSNEPIISESADTESQEEAEYEDDETDFSEQEKGVLAGKIILIDPGHGINSENRKEPVAPGSDEMKSAFVSGTAGKNQTEEELNLSVGLMLSGKLSALGADTFMTRETHECDVSNVGRAEMGNSLGADLVIRIHADGSNSSSAKGASMLIPSTKYVSDEVYQNSKIAGNILFEEFIKATGAKNRGVVERSDMTGFNWSEVPVVLIEMGFMSNPEEDALLETVDYQEKITDGLVSGVIRYFEEG